MKATGKKATLRTMEARDLHIDPRVQRGIDESQVKKLVANWDDMKVGPLIGSQRKDGKV